MRIDIEAALPERGSWFTPFKDGSGTMKLEFSATEFSKVIQMSQFMDCYTKGGKTFRVIITDEPLVAEQPSVPVRAQKRRKAVATELES